MMNTTKKTNVKKQSASTTSQETQYNSSMNNTTKKTPAEKQLIKFRNQLHTLLIRNPEIRLATDSFGDIVAFIPEGDRPRVHLPTSAWIRTEDTDRYERAYLPTSGKQELIQPADEYVANMRCRIGNK